LARGPDPAWEGRLSDKTFDKIRRLVYDRAGISLQDGKQQLVVARLTRKLRQTGVRSFDEYFDRVVADRSGQSLVALIDALTTNYTSFLREPAHFEFLKNTVLPRLAPRDSGTIWCAAAATGEEPYSLLFSMQDVLGPPLRARARVLATDISSTALDAAKNAIYAEERFSGVPRQWLPDYLLRGDGKYKGLYRVKPEMRNLVDFRRLNLIEQFTMREPFPAIFCRNVMIYFDKSTQERVVRRLSMFLEPGGYLFVGLSEGLTGIRHELRFVQPAIYQKPERQ
jgi:chemotaxis protein methyltransferase CheR